MITISMISAAYTQAFLDAFASLGIEPWAGIEMDVAWGQTTLRFGLHRPSVTGPIFVYRVCTALRQETPTRMQVLSHADLSPDQLLSAIAGQHPDLRDTWADGGWQLCAIDATRGHSRDRSLMHPCYVGRGMGSPIPSVQEGAWTREGPKFVDGGRGVRPLMSSFWNHERTWLRLTP